MNTDNTTSASKAYTENWGVIVNPVAGKRHLRKEWINIYRTLKRAAIHFSVQSTEYPGHAILLTRDLLKNGFRRILIIGGDGTVNEVVNGIFTSGITDTDQVTIALIPYGTGNDWARYWGLNRLTRRQIIDTLQRRLTRCVDVCYVDYTDHGTPRRQYFINGAGFGFDGLVVRITNHLKRLLGGHAWVYTLSVLVAIFRYRPTPMIITTADTRIDDHIFTISIGNACYSGGGLKQTDADPTDGKFFITLVPPITFSIIISGLRHLFRGTLYNHPAVQTIETSQITVNTLKQVDVETDGVEINGNGTFTFHVIPHALHTVIRE